MTLPTFIVPGSNHCIAWSLTFGTFVTLGFLGLDATQACEDIGQNFEMLLLMMELVLWKAFRWLIDSWQLEIKSKR